MVVPDPAGAVDGGCSQCRDAGSSCLAAADVGFVVFDRAWTEGLPHILGITHEADRNRFVFVASGGDAPAERREIVYGDAGTDTDRRAGELRVENSPAFCDGTDGIPRAEAAIDARFDNVRVAAVPAARR